jgi:hypothetical protein
VQNGNSFLLQIRLNFIVDRTSGTDKKPQYLSRWKGSNQLLLVAIGFCLVLSSAAEPYFKGFCGFDVFIWVHLNSSIYAEMV